MKLDKLLLGVAMACAIVSGAQAQSATVSIDHLPTRTLTHIVGHDSGGLAGREPILDFLKPGTTSPTNGNIATWGSSGNLITDSGKSLPSGAIVGTLDPQILYNKNFVTPALGTPASGVMTNVTGLPLTTGVTGILGLVNGGTGGTTQAAARAGIGAAASGSNSDITSISGLTSALSVGQGGTGTGSASGTALDNITGFSSTGVISRTGSGTYSFTPIGTSGATLPLLSTANTWSGTQSYSSQLNVSGMASGTHSSTWGTNQSLGGSVVWNSAPVRMGMPLTLASRGDQNDEFLMTLQTTTQPTPAPTGTTNGATSTSSAVLNFASVPAGIITGMLVQDTTHPTAIINTLTVVSQTSTTVTLSGNVVSPGVSSGDTIIFAAPDFKGPLFIDTVQNNPSYLNSTRAGNGLTIYSEIGTGVTNGYVEGIVVVAQGNGTGTGLLIPGEFDISPGASDTATNVHCDVSGISACHTNLWVANFGAVAGSWMFDSAVGGSGWKNGISIRNVNSGGIGLEVPSTIGIYSRNAANSADLLMLYADVNNDTNVKSSVGNILLNVASGSGVYFQVAGVSKALFNSSGSFNPNTTNTGTIGDNTHIWQAIYGTTFWAGSTPTQGKNCGPGTPTSSFTVIGGIVTNC